MFLGKKIYFKFLSFHLLILFSQQTDECPKETPIEYQNSCHLKYCTKSDYLNNNCIISNNIIKTQWLNNIILVGDKSYIYINTLITYNNELIVSTYPFNINKTNEIYKKRKFFGIKSNGRGMFYDKNTNLLETKKTSNKNCLK